MPEFGSMLNGNATRKSNRYKFKAFKNRALALAETALVGNKSGLAWPLDIKKFNECNK